MSDLRPLVRGTANGTVLLLEAPLSFWGGLDPATGCIIDRRHPQCGACVTGCVLVMPGGRGSSSSSTVLAEAIRRGTAPAAIILAESDPIVVLGAVVAEILYHRTVPVVTLEQLPIEGFRDGQHVFIDNESIHFGEPGELRASMGGSDADTSR
jgi:hypothetical protein